MCHCENCGVFFIHLYKSLGINTMETSSSKISFCPLVFLCAWDTCWTELSHGNLLVMFAAEVPSNREEGSQEQRCAAQAQILLGASCMQAYSRVVGTLSMESTFGFHPLSPFSSSPGSCAKLLVRINFPLGVSVFRPSLPDFFLLRKRKGEILGAGTFFFYLFVLKEQRVSPGELMSLELRQKRFNPSTVIWEMLALWQGGCGSRSVVSCSPSEALIEAWNSLFACWFCAALRVFVLLLKKNLVEKSALW